MNRLVLDLDDIQGDVLEGLQKNAECFVFFKIVSPALLKDRMRLRLLGQVTSARVVRETETAIARRRAQSGRGAMTPVQGLNIGFTRTGIAALTGDDLPPLDAAFDRGTNHPRTLEDLNDPAPSTWLKKFTSQRIDGLLLVTGIDKLSVERRAGDLLQGLGGAVEAVYSEIGSLRPGRWRKHEHFGFRDNISQPGVRGLLSQNPDQGLPGHDLLWPGEFVFGYPGQDAHDPEEPGPEPEMAASWMRNGSYMVFRRLEQKVPEFHRFVAVQASRFGMHPELLAARMVGRWKSGAPLELAPAYDRPALADDERRRNDFGYASDPSQRKCPYAAHIRKADARDDAGDKAEARRHRIIRAGIPFGPEVEPGEMTTRHSRGLMFVCYQTSIERQFEYIQRRANDPSQIAGKRRPSGMPVTPGHDPIIGQAPNGGARTMDEPVPNYPAGSRHSTLELPEQFVVLTAAAYFFMPSITALRTVLAR